jgi:hypothetical protein
VAIVLEWAVGRDSGPEPIGANGLVAFHTGIVDGMAIRARDGASRKALGDIVKWAMAAWDSEITE